jgi:Fur family iron response transcriptional regulator
MAQNQQFLGMERTDKGASANKRTVHARLKAAGLRPTRQRVALASLLFAQGNRHVSAEQLHAEVRGTGMSVSLATVYNTLHQFTGVGLLRVVAIEGNRSYFDTNTSDHYHFYIEHENRVIDVPGNDVSVANLPEPPEGMEIANVDIVIRLRKKS